MDGISVFFIVATVIALIVSIITATVYIVAILKYGKLFEKMVEEEKNK